MSIRIIYVSPGSVSDANSNSATVNLLLLLKRLGLSSCQYCVFIANNCSFYVMDDLES